MEYKLRHGPALRKLVGAEEVAGIMRGVCCTLESSKGEVTVLLGGRRTILTEMFELRLKTPSVRQMEEEDKMGTVNIPGAQSSEKQRLGGIKYPIKYKKS